MKNDKPNSSNCSLRPGATNLIHHALKALLSLMVLAFVQQAGAQTYSLSNAWTATNTQPGTHIATGDVDRGMGYDVGSNQVFVVNKGTPAIDVFDGTTGSLIGGMNVSWCSGGNFKIDQVGVADDGVIYSANLQTAPSATALYKIYRWANWSDTSQVTAFGGDPTYAMSLPGKRIGDTMAVTGSGTNTLILAGLLTSAATTNVALFSTVDGTNFTSTIVAISGLPAAAGGVSFGLAFYTNGTFMIKPNGSANLYLVQYPSNFAGQQLVSATVIASTPLAGSNVELSYNATAKLLATHPAATSAVNFYSFPSFATGLTALATTTLPVPNANGNQTGGVALGGQGKTNFLYALDTNNGLLASLINFTPAAVAPTITTQPVGGTIYTNAPSFVLSVGASGSVPFHYQWQLNSNNIAGATNANYTLSLPSTNASGYYDVIVSNTGGSATSTSVLVSVIAPVSSSVVTQLWSLAAGSRSYLGTGDYNTRGIAYDTNTSRLAVSDHGNTTIYVLDANTGADLFTMNTLGIAGGTFGLNLVGVADDGVLYGGNLAITANHDGYSLYSWPSVDSNAAPAQAYGPADPGNGSGDRWGDSMSVRGAGVNTQIILGSYNSNNVVLFTTTDGATFNPVLINVPGAPNAFAGLGIAFGAGNTFWAKSSGYDLRQVSFDPVAGTASIIQDFATPSQIPSSLGGIGVDVSMNILAGTMFSDNPNDLQLYTLTTNAAPPTIFEQAFYATANANSQANAAVSLNGHRAYGLDVNNGIVALAYGTPPVPSLPSYKITVVTGSNGSVSLTWQSVAGHTYQVQYKNSLDSTGWTNAGSAISATGSTTSYTDTVTGTGTRFYRIQGL